MGSDRASAGKPGRDERRPQASRSDALPAFRPSYQPDFRPDLKPDSLAMALIGAAHAAAAVHAGASLTSALSSAFALTDASPGARGAIQDLAYRCMRQLGRSEALLAAMAPKPPEPAMLAMLLCCAISLIDAPDETPPYQDFTVVDQAVAAAGAHPDMVRAKGMVNAVLRRLLRERASLVEQVLQQESARWNYPQWWIDATRAAYPADWQAILEAGNRQPPLTLRVNRRKVSTTDYLGLLSAEGLSARIIGASAIRLDRPVPVQALPGFAEGMVSVQDAAAQLAAPLLDAGNGMRVLDACAAPGGKTGHLLELADLDLTALDADAQRLTRVEDNLARLGLSAQLLQADAQSSDWWDGQLFDRILADVPCTASGVVRRHPDIRWLRRKTDTYQLATLSGQILDNLWHMLKPNGKLLFVTCSLWSQESEAQAAAFAARHHALRLPAPGQLLPGADGTLDQDGLFYALFQKGPA